MVLKNFTKLSLLALVSFSLNMAVSSKTVVKEGDKVEVKYSGYLKDGRVFDSNLYQKDKTLSFVVGSGSVLEDFNNAVLGLAKKESTTIAIPAVKAYGDVDTNKIIKLNASQLPADSQPGKRLELKSLNRTIPVRLVELEGDTAYVDANHLLAGKDLNFDIKVLKIEKTKIAKDN
jgi:peptidylprolyl isomerase